MYSDDNSAMTQIGMTYQINKAIYIAVSAIQRQLRWNQSGLRPESTRKGTSTKSTVVFWNLRHNPGIRAQMQPALFVSWVPRLIGSWAQ